MSKVKVYVTWERKDSNELEEKGKISLKKVQTYEFDTQGEVDARSAKELMKEMVGMSRCGLKKVRQLLKMEN